MHMARIVGQKKAREIWFLCSYYSAKEALDMGLVNTVVPLADLEQVGFLDHNDERCQKQREDQNVQWNRLELYFTRHVCFRTVLPKQF